MNWRTDTRINLCTDARMHGRTHVRRHVCTIIIFVHTPSFAQGDNASMLRGVMKAMEKAPMNRSKGKVGKGQDGKGKVGKVASVPVAKGKSNVGKATSVPIAGGKGKVGKAASVPIDGKGKVGKAASVPIDGKGKVGTASVSIKEMPAQARDGPWLVNNVLVFRYADPPAQAPSVTGASKKPPPGFVPPKKLSDTQQLQLLHARLHFLEQQRIASSSSENAARGS